MDNFEIDEDLVRSLLQEQHPDLAGLPLGQAATGWDNQLWRLGDELAVRLPRTSRAPTLLRHEQRWLPILAPRLPLAVPTPVRVGRPSERFPRPWTVATWVPGEPGDRATISRDCHAADGLAEFLRALHRPAPKEAPANPSRGVPLELVASEFDRKLHTIATNHAATNSHPSSHGSADVQAVWDDAASAPEWDGPPVWLHGDLHPANVVISDGTLSGVIDFGELCAGDPATDLAAAWLLLPDGAATRLLEAYADADAATIRRARGWAVLRSVSLIGIGQAWERGLPGGQPTWGRAGRSALDRALAAT